MNKFINVGDTIEGSAIDCITRSWNHKGLKKHPTTQKTMCLYVTDKNSEAIVVGEINVEYDKSIKEKTAHFHREKGDTIQGDSLSVYVDKKQKIVAKVVNGNEASGRHKAQKAHLSYHSIAEIKVCLDSLRKLLGYSNNHIVNTEISCK